MRPAARGEPVRAERGPLPMTAPARGRRAAVSLLFRWASDTKAHGMPTSASLGPVMGDRTGIGWWKWPMNSRKAHWFPAGEARSACGRWLYTGDPTETQSSPSDKPGPDDCAPCWRAMRKERTR